MSDKATKVIDWMEQVSGVPVDDHQREVIRRLYDTRVPWPTPHHLSVLGRSSGGDLRHEGEPSLDAHLDRARSES